VVWGGFLGQHRPGAMANPDDPLTPEEIQTATEAFLDRMCSQADCEQIATYRFTWPGSDEQKCCAACALKAKGIADAMGLHLQVRPLQ